MSNVHLGPTVGVAAGFDEAAQMTGTPVVDIFFSSSTHAKWNSPNRHLAQETPHAVFNGKGEVS